MMTTYTSTAMMTISLFLVAMSTVGSNSPVVQVSVGRVIQQLPSRFLSVTLDATMLGRNRLKHFQPSLVLVFI